MNKKIQDTYSKKRVELHAHTKMSAMDGLNDIRKMIQTAKEWGHKAVAITDHGGVYGFPGACYSANTIKIIYGCEGYMLNDDNLIAEDGTIDYKNRETNHVTILAKNKEGLKNLYKLVSLSHMEYFHKTPRIPKSILGKYREGLVIGSACNEGEIYKAILNKESEDNLKRLVDFYDYLEIQPIINNRFLLENGYVKNEEELRNINRKIIELGRKYGKLVAATCDAHYFNAEDDICRKILMASQGFNDVESDEGLYFRTTNEMMEEFSYLGEDTAYEVVIENTNKIADMIEEIQLLSDEKCYPVIDGAEEDLRRTCKEKAISMYGTPLPEEIKRRLDTELNTVIDNGYAVIYRIMQMLVNKSKEDGYLVGSKGSVGASLAAYMAGITEINPLPAHYLCPNCKHLEWGDEKQYGCGVDMPEKNCPICGTPYKKEGFTMPFEAFLGFGGDREPDIDLNFAGEYLTTVHKYVKEIFGSENVYKAGAIGAIKDKLAYGYVTEYFEEREINVDEVERKRLISCIKGASKTISPYPGSIIIVPRGHEIYEFCSVQHPVHPINSDDIITQFEHLEDSLLKLDILGHDVPSMLKQIQSMTGVDPSTVPLDDDKVMSIFIGTEGLDIKNSDYKFTHGSYGISEFDSKYVRQMLDDSQPTSFEELVRISGLSHGMNVWLGNAQDLIVNGVTTIKEAIATRDDIMNYLRLKGLSNKDAFNIMEKVRRGKGLTEYQEMVMRENDVPDWYIDSCKEIKYMFPRAHAVSYVMMSVRIAYYKVYYPVEFYATYFTAKAEYLDKKVILDIMDIAGVGFNEIITKRTDNDHMIEVAYEMYSRGYEFAPPIEGISDDIKFIAHDGKVLLPLTYLAGVDGH